MRPDQTPIVFVALLMEPEQFGLFEEIAAEAIDIIDESPSSSPSVVSGNTKQVLIDRAYMRMALSWSESSVGDVLTLAVGAQPDQTLSDDDARLAADLLRELVKCAEALFEVRRSRWQVASLPLDAATIKSHARQLGGLSTKAGYQVGSPFVPVEPDLDENPGMAVDDSQQDNLPTPMAARAATQDAEPNWAMQASALALSTTFVIVSPPVGIAMLTYAALRQGADMDLLPRNQDLAHA